MIFKKSLTKIFVISLSFVFFGFNIFQLSAHAQNFIEPPIKNKSEMFVAENDKITPNISQKSKVNNEKRLSPRKQLEAKELSFKTIFNKKNWSQAWKYSNLLEKTQFLAGSAVIITWIISLLV